jgi:hypothetical protein
MIHTVIFSEKFTQVLRVEVMAIEVIAPSCSLFIDSSEFSITKHFIAIIENEAL